MRVTLRIEPEIANIMFGWTAAWVYCGTMTTQERNNLLFENACKEGRLPGLDGACDPALADLLDFWGTLYRDDGPPLRENLDPFALKKWLGHISIFEVLDDGDFIIRLEGSAIVDMTGENWTTHRASEIDKKYGSLLVEHMTKSIEANKPSFHRMMIFQRRHFFATRTLLPVRKNADCPANQIFLVLYRDIVQPDE